MKTPQRSSVWIVENRAATGEWFIMPFSVVSLKRRNATRRITISKERVRRYDRVEPRKGTK